MLNNERRMDAKRIMMQARHQSGGRNTQRKEMNIQKSLYGTSDEKHQRSGGLPWRTRFERFVQSQEKYRFLWMIVSLIGQSCVLTPGVLALIFYSDAGLLPLLLCAASVMVVFVTNLAAMPVKIVLPALALSLLTDVMIAVFCVGRLLF